MEAFEYLGDIREKYVSFYRSVLREKRRNGVECAAEVWVEANVQPGEPKPPHPLCIDVLEKDGEKQQMAMVGGSEAAEGALIGTMQVANVLVKVYAAVWDALPVWFSHADPDWAGLDEWKRKWMDRNRTGAADEDGLSGVVHYLGEAIAEGGGFVYVVDFGSAPVEALMELTQALAGMGAGEIELGRSDGSDLSAEIQATLRRPKLSWQDLTGTIVRVLESVPGMQSVRQVGEGEISVNDGALRIYTGNLYQVLMRVGVEARAKEVYRFVRGHRESMAPKAAPDLSQLRLVVKDDRFFEQMGELCPGAKPLVRKRLAGALWLACVWDQPNGMRFVTEDEPQVYGLTQEMTLERAKHNYLKGRGEVQVARDGCLWVAQTRDCYDATLLVDDEWWEERQSLMEGDLLACAPARHVVLIGDSAHPETLRQMRQAARKVEAGGDHLVSGSILVRRDGCWEPIEKNPSAMIPEEGRDGGAGGRETGRRRPWWKFW